MVFEEGDGAAKVSDLEPPIAERLPSTATDPGIVEAGRLKICILRTWTGLVRAEGGKTGVEGRGKGDEAGEGGRTVVISRIGGSRTGEGASRAALVNLGGGETCLESGRGTTGVGTGGDGRLADG